VAPKSIAARRRARRSSTTHVVLCARLGGEATILLAGSVRLRSTTPMKDEEEAIMANVVVALTMSVDGFVAHEGDSVGHLFDWYSQG